MTATVAAMALLATRPPDARADRDLTDAQAERIVSMCEDEPKKGRCGMFALICARSRYQLGSNKHEVCKQFHLVYPRAGLATVIGGAYHTVRDPSLVGDLDGYAALSGKSRGVLRALHLALGLDLELGRGLDGGFAYDVAASAGVGHTFAGSLAAGLTAGLGTDGVTGDRIPLALTIPIELFVTGNVGPYNHFIAWGRSSVTALSDERSGGSDAAPFGDELALGAGIGFGNNRVSLGHRRARGVMLGFEYRERMDTSFVGVVLAYSSFSHGNY